MVDLADNALTTLARVKEDLGIAVDVTTFDDRLKRAINAASQSIESYCGRIFYRAASITEKVAGYGRSRLRVSRTPLNNITSIAYDGATLGSTTYEVDNSGAGLIHVEGGVHWTAYAKGDVSQGPLPGTERKLYTIVYDGGWYTPKQEDDTPANVRTLPWDLEEACIELVRGMYRGKNRDPAVTSESLGPWSASYNVITQGGDFPPSVRRVIDRYRRIS